MALNDFKVFDSFGTMSGTVVDGGQRYCRLVFRRQRVGRSLVVAGHPIAMPPDVALHVGELACQSHLRVEFVTVVVARIGHVHGALHVLTDVKVAVMDIVVPPLHQLAARRGLRVQIPVELRHDIVHPSLAVPQQHIGVEAVVVLQTAALRSARVGRLVAPDAERTDAETHPGLLLFDGIVKLLDQLVHILPTPVAAVHAVAEFTVARIVGYRFARGRVGVEVIVDMNAVHIVALQNVAHHLADEITVLLICRIKQHLPVVTEKPMRLTVRQMVGGQRLLGGRRHPVGIEPSMELHAAAVCLGDGEFHRIPHRIRSFAPFAGQPCAPGLQLRLVDGIGRRPHLEYHHIAAGILQLVELVHDIGPGLFGALVLPLTLADDMKPGPPELPFRIVVGKSSQRYGQCQKQL